MFVGARLCDWYPHAERWEVIKYKTTMAGRGILLIALLIATVYGAYVAGAQFNPVVVPGKPTVVQVQVVAPSPVMDRIATCESSGMQQKNGQTLIKVNTNGTYDQGVYQINSTWNKQAAALGYDLSKESDNRSFAMWIYENQGTGAWSASAKCWNK